MGGMPVYIPELEDVLSAGKTESQRLSRRDDPSWQCTECGAQFFRELRLIKDN